MINTKIRLAVSNLVHTNTPTNFFCVQNAYKPVLIGSADAWGTVKSICWPIIWRGWKRGHTDEFCLYIKLFLTKHYWSEWLIIIEVDDIHCEIHLVANNLARMNSGTYQWTIFEHEAHSYQSILINWPMLVNYMHWMHCKIFLVVNCFARTDTRTTVCVYK